MTMSMTLHLKAANESTIAHCSSVGLMGRPGSLKFVATLQFKKLPMTPTIVSKRKQLQTALWPSLKHWIQKRATACFS
jgi:hypothetical protein